MVKKRTKPPLKIKQIESALKKSNGLISHAAELLDVSAPAIHDRIKRSERLQEVRRQIEQQLIDDSENVVYHHMKSKNLTAAIFHLKTKGKNRGWIEKHEAEVTGRDNGPIKITLSKAEFQKLRKEMLEEDDC